MVRLGLQQLYAVSVHIIVEELMGESEENEKAKQEYLGHSRVATWQEAIG